jgi:hypothetical protein
LYSNFFREKSIVIDSNVTIEQYANTYIRQSYNVSDVNGIVKNACSLYIDQSTIGESNYAIKATGLSKINEIETNLINGIDFSQEILNINSDISSIENDILTVVKPDISAIQVDNSLKAYKHNSQKKKKTEVEKINKITASEINMINDVTSNIQEQFNTLVISDSTLNTEINLKAYKHNSQLTGNTNIDKLIFNNNSQTKQITIEYDETNDYGKIECTEPGVRGNFLCINPLYGGDLICGSNVHVNNSVISDNVECNNLQIFNSYIDNRVYGYETETYLRRKLVVAVSSQDSLIKKCMAK